jgi:hypothetical protein
MALVYLGRVFRKKTVFVENDISTNSICCSVSLCNAGVVSQNRRIKSGTVLVRVARWFVFKPKIPISEKISGPQI